MIKKSILIIILLLVMISCGKKGDPVFKESKKKIEIQNVIIKNT